MAPRDESHIQHSFAPVQNRTSRTFNILLHQFKTGQYNTIQLYCLYVEKFAFKTGRVAHSKFVCASWKQDDSFAPVQNRTSRTFKIRLRHQFRKGRFFCTSSKHTTNQMLDYSSGHDEAVCVVELRAINIWQFFHPSRKKCCGKACDDFSCSQPAIRRVF